MKSPVILVVEDESLTALDLIQTIEELGMEVEGPYSTTGVALKRAQGRELTCAILDVKVLDGEVYPLADELDRRGVPIIFHSGAATPPRLRARYPNAIICQKPCFSNDIRAAILAVSDGSRDQVRSSCEA